MLRTYFNGLKDTFTPAGSSIRDDFEVQIDENGLECYVKIGETDLQALYDSYRDSCDLSVLVKTLVDSGINPFSSAKITYLDDEETLDITSIDGTSLSDKLEALRNYDKNKKLIDEYIAAQEAEKAKQAAAAGGQSDE